MTTGQRIKSARKKANMTQVELAKKLGIPYQSIGQWENDLRNPKFETLERIATALDVHTFDLLGIDLNQLDPYVHETSDIVFPPNIPESVRNEFIQKISGMSATEMFEDLPPEKKSEFLDMVTSMSLTSPPLVLTTEEKNLLTAYRIASPDDRAIIDNIVHRYAQDIKKQHLA